MSEQKYAGQLVQTTYPITGPESVEPVMLWHYEAPDRHCLPELFTHDHAVGLVNNELIYVHRDGKWNFSLEQTNLFHALFKKPGVTRTTPPTDPVAGIEFSSKPRNEWTIGNWIAHVGGDIRSDHFVVFGSVMAVDMMIRQIVKCQLKEIEAAADSGDLRVIVQGGTKEERIMMWAGICGMIEGIDVKSAPYLQSVIDELNAGRGLNGQKTMEFLSNFSPARELLLDIAKDISTGE